MSSKKDYPLAEIYGQFQTDAEFIEAKPFGTGHINDTFMVETNYDFRIKHYILQRINHFVFKSPEKVQHNFLLVTDAMNKLYKGHPDAQRRGICLMLTNDNKPYYKDSDGNYWRMYDCAEHVMGYDVVENESQAYQAAKGFGFFLKALSTIDPKDVYETIPHFHDTPWRLEALEAAIAADKCGRVASCQAEIDFVLSRKDETALLLNLNAEGKIPMRITHNDCKLGNVLLDSVTNEAIRVIDLDTIMPGLAHFDFGDLVRTSTSPAFEDEQDLSKVFMRPNIFKALLNGYLAATHDTLNETEIEYLPFSGKLITLEIGIRFLTDYLSGDEYFKTKYDEHNLVRSRTQFKLVQSMEEQWDEMQVMLKDAVNSVNG